MMGNRDGKGRAILMCAGEYEPMEILRGAEDFVVAVDGGLARLLEAGIEPDLVLGDFDSLEEKYLPWLDCLKNTRPERLSQLPCEKDDTDTLHAVRVCLERGYKRIDLYGALGGRLDHTIANIQTLSWIRRQGGCGYLLGKNTLATVLCGEMILLPVSNVAGLKSSGSTTPAGTSASLNNEDSLMMRLSGSYLMTFLELLL